MGQQVGDDRDHAENLEQDLTEQDFKAMEGHLAAMEDHLFNAGVAILQSAKTQEQLFNTSIEAIQEALKPGSTEVETLEPDSKKSLPSHLSDAQNQSGAQNQDVSLPAIWQKLSNLEAGQTRLEQRLDTLIQHLVPRTQSILKPQATESIAAQKSLEFATSEWTEKSLKKEYKTLATLRSQLGIEAKNWKVAVSEANALRTSA